MTKAVWVIAALCASLACADGAAARDRRTTFPEIQDWNSLRMTFETHAGFWGGPSYRVEVAGDGTVWYEGLDGVAAKGPVPLKISRAQVEALFAAFRRADFFVQRDAYAAQMYDIGTDVVTLTFDGRSKSVRDHMGTFAGMPASVTKIERAMKAIDGLQALVEGYQ